jgi:hypothetical protein
MNISEFCLGIRQIFQLGDDGIELEYFCQWHESTVVRLGELSVERRHFESVRVAGRHYEAGVEPAENGLMASLIDVSQRNLGRCFGGAAAVILASPAAGGDGRRGWCCLGWLRQCL